MRAKLSNHAAAIFMAVAVLLGSSYFYQVHQESARATCQSEYNAAFAKQSTIRSQINTDSDDAKTVLLQGVGTALAAPATTDPKIQAARSAAFLQLFSTYDQQVQKVADERAANPLPPLPDC